VLRDTLSGRPGWREYESAKRQLHAIADDSDELARALATLGRAA
jgi:hypothetical protein